MLHKNDNEQRKLQCIKSTVSVPEKFLDKYWHVRIIFKE